jgi:ribosomal protein S12 methylthiotransferase accessory factor YcaO
VLLSALAYDALTRVLRDRIRPTHLDLDALADPVLRFLLRTAEGLDLTPELLELDATVPVVFARCSPPATGDRLWTLAAATSIRVAAIDALRDLIGTVQLAAALAVGESVDTGDPVLPDLDPRTLAAADGRRGRPPRDTTLTEVLDRLRAESVEPLAVDRGASDLASGGLYAARVLLNRCPDVT